MDIDEVEISGKSSSHVVDDFSPPPAKKSRGRPSKSGSKTSATDSSRCSPKEERSKIEPCFLCKFNIHFMVACFLFIFSLESKAKKLLG